MQFALRVIEHRKLKRQRFEERARQDAESDQRHQAGREAQYGIAAPPDPVSTPPNGLRCTHKYPPHRFQGFDGVQIVITSEAK